MLDELRRLFIAALVCHEEEDAMEIIKAWNEEIERLQIVFDQMIDKSALHSVVKSEKEKRDHYHDA